jgi:prenyltransferase beta subunit
VSLRLQMLQVARLAPRVLDDATELVAAFLKSQQNPDGGFRDKSGGSDLYYTVFGLDASLALQVDLDKELLRSYLAGFGEGGDLDFVHLCSLIRCRSIAGLEGDQVAVLSARLATFRAQDGGFNPKTGAAVSTVYANFLAYAAYQDLGQVVPDVLKMVQSFKHLETEGSWANERHVKTGATPATAAAVSVLHDQGMPISDDVSQWLVSRLHPMGGFLAAPQAPVPDLLSTATALHALAGLEVPFKPFKELSLDFIDSLWTNEGSFYGHWQEETLDCEYTYYALLALGHLSVG